MTSAAVASQLQDRIYKYFKQRNGDNGRPEYRLILTQGGSIILPVGLLIWVRSILLTSSLLHNAEACALPGQGWTAQAETHWIVPMIGIAIFCFGLMQGFVS
jgi:DHA1 family multidrug resistance protein-like MFS transporter